MQSQILKTNYKYAKMIFKIMNIVKTKYKFLNDIDCKLKFKYVKEISVTDQKINILIIFVPIKTLVAFRRAQHYFILEFEKYYKNSFVTFCGFRTILPKKFQKIKNNKTYSFSYPKVLDSTIKDVIFPANIIGKRVFFYSHNSITHQIYVESSMSLINQKKLNYLSKALSKILGNEVIIELVTQ